MARSQSSAGSAGAVARRLARSTALSVCSRWRCAIPAWPYRAKATSPCSVMRIPASRLPRGCPRIARLVGPPPRPTAPPRPWKSSGTPAVRPTAVSPPVRYRSPMRREEAAVLVRVRRTEHHLLQAVPGLEMPAVHGQGQLGQDRAAPAQVLDRLEQGHDLEAALRRIRFRREDARLLGEEQRGEDVAHARRHRHDVHVAGLGTELLLHAADGPGKMAEDLPPSPPTRRGGDGRAAAGCAARA